jgi:hypothetical protein
LQPHIGVYFRKKENKDIREGGKDAYDPHGAMLLYLQKKVQEAGCDAEVFEEHL